MIRYIGQKFGTTLMALWGVASLVFFLFTVLPGDPAQMMMDQNEDSAQLEIIKAKFGFDLPLTTQYFNYLNDLLPVSIHSNDPEQFGYYDPEVYGGWVISNFDQSVLVIKAPYFRTSYQKRGKPIAEIIKETLPNTALLAVSSMSIAIVLGVFFGIVATLNKDTWLDRFLLLFSTLGMSVPSFFSAILFSWFFGYVLHEFTGLNMTGSLYELDDLGEGNKLQWKNLVLPSFVLGIRPLAVIIQLLRSNLLEVMTEDYIRTAYAKGLSHYQVLFKHAIKNALNPVITAISGWFASLLAGAIFVEYIFGWKGLGKEIVEALNQLDIPVVMGAVLTIAFFFIIINIVVDFIYAYLDPRIKTF
ncbi:MAG: ABC transporter permease [Flavobacteriaceae bacterium]|jgi:peptide/nickel transport system permease protein|nr:ABC transporter permease [Flavobacteriaceae bacterium]